MNRRAIWPLVNTYRMPRGFVLARASAEAIVSAVNTLWEYPHGKLIEHDGSFFIEYVVPPHETDREWIFRRVVLHTYMPSTAARIRFGKIWRRVNRVVNAFGGEGGGDSRRWYELFLTDPTGEKTLFEALDPENPQMAEPYKLGFGFITRTGIRSKQGMSEVAWKSATGNMRWNSLAMMQAAHACCVTGRMPGAVAIEHKVSLGTLKANVRRVRKASRFVRQK